MGMRTGLTAGAVMALALLATGADALPLAPLPQTAADGGIVMVRDGCGPEGHRSHYGYCKFDGPRFDGPRHFDGPPRFYGGYPAYGGPVYRRPRCFIRETYEGPVRVCR